MRERGEIVEGEGREIVEGEEIERDSRGMPKVNANSLEKKERELKG